jgi:hypothetical protein
MSIVASAVNERNEMWNTASFRIAGDALRPDQMTAILGIQPTRSGVKGERHSCGHGSVSRTSFWLLKCPLNDSLPLTEHLKWLLDVFEPKYKSINSAAEGATLMFLCGFAPGSGQGGFTLDAKTLQRIAALGVPLSINLYPPESVG